MDIRQRVQKSSQSPSARSPLQHYYQPAPDRNLPRLGLLSWLTIFAYIAVVQFTSRHIASHLPDPWPSSQHGDTRDLTRFSEDRALQHLIVLTSFRPRTVGTDGNDRFAARYIIKEAEAIKKKASPVHRVEIDHQVVSGSFRLAFLGFNNAYQDVHNVLVRIGPVDADSNRTLLVNCHFDAAIGVDGASDDLAQCVSMLEVLTVLSQRGTLPANLLFLFNGAEESILQGSHGFVTQHPWAKDITAFINLEAAGSGGRDALFQTGPKHPWLVRAYSRVPYPCGNSMGEEIFQSGVIPSDTDFRIFRDHGQLPGVDIAYVENGYIYHTHYDTIDQITRGTLQRSGENLLALIYGILTSPEFYDLENCVTCASDSAVYYDFLGLTFIMYSYFTGLVVNYFFAVTASLAILLELQREIRDARALFPDVPILKGVVCGVLVVLTSWTLPVAVSGGLGYAVSLLAPMSWFARPVLSVALYAVPAVGVVFALHTGLFGYRDMVSIPLALKESLVYYLTGLVWIVILVGMTVKGLTSAFVPLFFVAAPIPLRFIWLHMQPTVRKDVVAFVMAHLICLALPTVFGLYVLTSAMEVFVPIFGRTGSELNPDVALAVLVAGITVLVGGYYSSLIEVTEKWVAWLIVKFSAVLFVSTVLVVAFSSVGFPYSSPPGPLVPKRLAMQHFHRETFNRNGTLTSSDNGVWIVPLDFQGVSPINLGQVFDTTPEEVQKRTEPMRHDLLYYGLPFIYPMMEHLKHHQVVKVPEMASVPYQPNVKKLDEQVLDHEGNWRTHRITLSAQLVDHSNVYLSPLSHCFLLAWNLTADVPMQGPISRDQQSFFVFLVAGYNPKKPVYEKVFWLDVRCGSGSSRASAASGVVEVGVVNHFLTVSSPLMDDLLKRMPAWVSTIHWINSLHLHLF
ncbi:endoplasmic reticulum metallopeptidase 1-like isoform X2 [Paramacrobiotus metropolitanus]|uniref:endoplasmic reticulum metallopeptidase 1-like isoform X2 n=1 Tax=Paramacrobiotus metropolitanus TaxID=2943436 RepID=UPI0024456BD6|nr:endoplasmic reticulum metallopeptidase 1-like isoform X2 [Paramacrobiotus metropolitanus]